MSASSLSLSPLPGLEYKPADFDLKRLTTFNPALVYTEAYRKPSDRFAYSTLIKYHMERSTLMFLNNEKRGALDAYLYAQDVVLPAIQSEGIQSITPAKLGEWVGEIHRRFTSFLGKSNGFIPGQYTSASKSIVRWYSNFESLTVDYFKCLTEERRSDFIKKQPKIMREFLALLRKIYEDPAIPWTLSADIRTEAEPGKLAILKMICAFRLQKLNAEEVAVLNNVVQITEPARLPQIMEQFFIQLLASWAECKPNNLNQVAELASFAFHGLGSIYPYAEGNESTAFCLVNIILVSLGHKSILMYNPDEFNDDCKELDYSVTIPDASVNQQRILTRRIRDRLNKDPYKDETDAAITRKMIEMEKIVSRLESLIPFDHKNRSIQNLQDLDFLLYAITREATWGLFPHVDLEDLDVLSADQFLKVITEMAAKLSWIERQVLRNQEKKIEEKKEAPVCFASPIRAPEYKLLEQDQIVSKLKELTAQESGNWQKCKEANGRFAVKFVTEDEALVRQMREIFKQHPEALTVKLLKEQNGERFELHFTAIKLEKLMQVKQPERSEMPKLGVAPGSAALG